MTKLEAAIDYGRKGIPVFPWRYRGEEKVPCVKGGHHAATTEETQIRAWWKKWPDASIGMPSGVRSDILTVDLDRKGTHEGGFLTAAYFNLPLSGAAIATSPGGKGRHAHFRSCGHALDRLADDSSPLPFIDLLGDGGWTALPTPGTPCQWENGINLTQAAPIPGEIVLIWQKPSKVERELLGAAKQLAAKPANSGRRNLLRDLAYKYGFKIAAEKLDERFCRDRLIIAARLSGLPDSEIGKTIDSGFEDARNKADSGSHGKRNNASRHGSGSAAPPDPAALERSAAPIIAAADVLSPFARAIGHMIAGEEESARLLYLVATSRLFAQPMHVAVKGESAGGKSQLRKAVLSFFPPEDVIAFTTLSERALLYFPEELSHKILSMGEAAGVEEQQFQDYLLRELMSEGMLRYPVAQKVGGEIVTRVIERRGPVCFFVTTTKDSLHRENETRMLSLEIDDSEAQTKAVLLKLANLVGANASVDEAHLEPWRDFQRWLAIGNRKVVIPYAATLAELTQPKSVRLRRDFVQLLDAIKAHALIHRNHRDTDATGQIVADIDHDYATARELMADMLAVASDARVRETTQAVHEAVKALQPEPPLKDNHGNVLADQGVTAADLAKYLSIDRSAAWRRLRTAEKTGLVMRLGQSKSRQMVHYRTTGSIDAEISLVPDVETLRKVFYEEN